MNLVLRAVFLWLSIGLLLAGAACGLLYWHFLAWSDAPIHSARETRLVISPGQTLSKVADALVENDYLSHKRRLVLLGRLTGADTRLQAGEYAFARDLTPRQLLSQLVDGKVITYDFRIIEGMTVSMLLAGLAENQYLQQQIESVDAESLQVELALSVPFAEGMFFPDTYQFVRGDSDRDLLQRAHSKMLASIAYAWGNRAPGLVLGTSDELVILASIIEKETGLEADRAQISQVFHSRLAKRMLLQTDPTVIYALRENFDGNLTRDHLKIDSPFNTYRVRGLPPTPIAIPSKASLIAAAHPAAGDYLYFVAKGDGGSQFSRTLAEHNKAVRRYQLGLTK